MTWLNNLFGEKGKKMSALIAGTAAPSFELPAMDGSKFSLPEALARDLRDGKLQRLTVELAAS